MSRFSLLELGEFEIVVTPHVREEPWGFSTVYDGHLMPSSAKSGPALFSIHGEGSEEKVISKIKYSLKQEIEKQALEKSLESRTYTFDTKDLMAPTPKRKWFSW